MGNFAIELNKKLKSSFEIYRYTIELIIQKLLQCESPLPSVINFDSYSMIESTNSD